MITVAWALQLLQAVPKAAAAAPQFKALWDQLIATFDKKADQQTLKDAYPLALSDAADAHSDLQALIASKK